MTLKLLIGPSGAGKSTIIEYLRETKGNIFVVSSDHTRKEMTGDFKDHSKEDKVWAYISEVVALRLSYGLDVYVDATNLKEKDRKAFLSLEKSPWKDIFYYVIDRPLEDKLHSGGWRLGVMKGAQNLVERHHDIMQASLPQIMKGDGDPRVKVWKYIQGKGFEFHETLQTG